MSASASAVRLAPPLSPPPHPSEPSSCAVTGRPFALTRCARSAGLVRACAQCNGPEMRRLSAEFAGEAMGKYFPLILSPWFIFGVGTWGLTPEEVQAARDGAMPPGLSLQDVGCVTREGKARTLCVFQKLRARFWACDRRSRGCLNSACFRPSPSQALPGGVARLGRELARRAPLDGLHEGPAQRPGAHAVSSPDRCAARGACAARNADASDCHRRRRATRSALG